MDTTSSSSTSFNSWHRAVEGGDASSTATDLPALTAGHSKRLAKYYQTYMLFAAGLAESFTKGLSSLNSATVAGAFELSGSKVESNCESESQQATRELRARYWNYLSKLEKSDLAFGERIEVLSRILGQGMDSNPWLTIEAITQILGAESNDISDDARAGVIRFLSSGYENVARRPLVRMCLSSLNSQYEQQVSAAARSLEEIGDLGIVPLLKSMTADSKYSEARQDIEGAIKGITNFYGVSKGSAERHLFQEQR